MATSMKSLGLLINCGDVEQRFHLLSCIMDLYKGLNIFATTPQEGWDAFADDVFERFILLNELRAEQRDQLRYLQCIGFEKCIKTVDSGSGSNISIIEINNDSKESKTALWVVAASMCLYDSCYYIATPKGICDSEIEEVAELFSDDFFKDGCSLHQCLVAYMKKIHSISMDFLLVMPLWGECNRVSLLLADDEMLLDAVKALPLNKGKVADYNNKIVFENPFDGPSLGFLE